MATPTGRNAADARGFHARVRRRKKQDQSHFDALVASPFDFGAVPEYQMGLTMDRRNQWIHG